MKEYILRRLISTLPILLGVVILTFFMLQLIPGDPASVMAGERATAQQIEQIRESRAWTSRFSYSWEDTL